MIDLIYAKVIRTSRPNLVLWLNSTVIYRYEFVINTQLVKPGCVTSSGPLVI